MPNDTQLPFSEAIEYFSDKINIDTDSWLEGAGTVQQVAFTVAGAKGVILQEIRDAVDAAINDGVVNPTDFAKNFDRIADSYVDNWELKGSRAWRAQLILEQSLRQADGEGRYRQLTEPETLKRRPYWQYRHGDSRVPRPKHLAMDQKVFPANSLKCFHPFGFGCKCRIFSLSQRDIDREGLKVEDVSDFEADKGFQYLPGKLTKERRDELLKGLDPDIRKLVLGDTEAEFARIPEGTTKVVGGKTYILTDSRWHVQERQSKYEGENRPLLSWLNEIEKQSKLEMTSEAEKDAQMLDVLKAIREQLLDGNLSAKQSAEIVDKIDFSGIGNQQREQQVREIAIEFFRLTNGAGAKYMKSFTKTKSRAYNSTFYINIGSSRSKDQLREDLFHELGHSAENDIPDHDNIKWVKSRATGKQQPLTKLVPGAKYGADEKAYPDKFIDPYVGKIYEDGGTEVVSMGLQHFTSPKAMLELWKTDKDHFRQTLIFLQKAGHV